MESDREGLQYLPRMELERLELLARHDDEGITGYHKQRK